MLFRSGDAFSEMQRIAPHVPVLICTGYGDNEEVEALLRAGARGLLMKPFTLHQLAGSLQRFRR